MKLAIDSYCFHRQFGSHYPGLQEPVSSRWSVWDFLNRARRLGVEGVSIESCFFEDFPTALVSRLRSTLDRLGMDRVWAWGHPAGLESGTNREAARDLVKHLAIARDLGAKVMRIVGGSRKTRPASWTAHRRQLTRMLKGLVGAAEEHQVVMAMENHIDLHVEEMLEVLNDVNSPWLGVCLDTGNNLRLFEDPVVVAARLAPWTRATHIKDLTAYRGNPREFSFWPSVPLGAGAVDLPAVLRHLRGAGYKGLLAIEVDYLHPEYPSEERAVAASVRYLRSLLDGKPDTKVRRR